MLWLQHEIKNLNKEWNMVGQIKLESLFSASHDTYHRNITIGRCSSVDIQIDNIGVSRWHAILTIRRDADNTMQLFVEDNRSENGTCINGQKIIESTKLQVGDSIDFFDRHRIILMESIDINLPQGLNIGRAGETHKQTLFLGKKGS